MKREFETVTKTQAVAAEAQAKVEAYLASGADGYIYNSILDAKTSSVCRTLHGRRYIWGEGRNPVPPMHYNCRSSIVPYFKGEPNELDGVNYYDWLKKQPASVQDEVLGVTLGRAFRNSGITPEQFRKASTNRFAEPLTIEEMKQKDERIASYLQQLHLICTIHFNRGRATTLTKQGLVMSEQETDNTGAPTDEVK